ncbi:MAG: sugar phosphate isomerase/epimerase [Spirosomataceae bacterium]
MPFTRRDFLHTLAGASAATALTSARQVAYPYPIACNSYNWVTFYARQKKNWGEDLDACLGDVFKSGLLAYEPALNKPEEVIKLAPVLQKYRLAMPSVYVGTTLHKADEAAASIKGVLAIADEVKKVGTRIMVTNPNPIRWGSNELKSDAELDVQASNLELLGAKLRQKGITLAYHTHDVELKAGAREFHHMLLHTSPQHVSFCFDVHWVYRGSQNSQAAVFDVLKLYGRRIVELHIRQSVNGVYSETFGEGDINYRRLAQELKSLRLRPHLVIEQCVEEKSPNTMDGVEAHQKDLVALREIFKPLLG